MEDGEVGFFRDKYANEMRAWIRGQGKKWLRLVARRRYIDSMSLASLIKGKP